MSPPAGARCAKHAETPAVDVCQRCGSFVCGECVNIRDEDIYCPDCVRFLDRPASRRPVIALVLLGTASLPLVTMGLLRTHFGPAVLAAFGILVLLTAVGAVVLIQERAARRRDQAPRKGVSYPLAWVALGLDCLLLAPIVILTVLGFQRASG